MKKLIALGTLATMVLGGGIAALSTNTPAVASEPTKTLIVGTEAGYAPYEYLDKQGNITGFDIELINHLCDQLGYKCIVKNMSFDGLIPAIKYKKIDLAIAAISPTPARLKQVNFTQSYTPRNSMSFLVAKNSGITKVDQVHTVAYQNGTLVGQYLQKETNYKLKAFESYDLALLDADAGRVDAVAADTPVINTFIKENPTKYTTVGGPIYNKLFENGLSIAVNKHNKALLDQFNTAIAKAKQDGYITNLLKKYDLPSQ